MLADRRLRLDHLHAQIRAYDPSAMLARGWSITTGPDGRVVRRVADVHGGDVLVTTVADGSLRSRVEPARRDTNGEEQRP
jgi:exodeoxyribonuclease VII large subunit